MPLLVCHQFGQKGWCGFRVGVHKHQQLPLALLHPLVQCPVFAAPARRQGRRSRHLHASGAGDRRGVITRTVVDHDHLERLQALELEGLEQPGQGEGFIAGGNQHRNLRPANRCELS